MVVERDVYFVEGTDEETFEETLISLNYLNTEVTILMKERIIKVVRVKRIVIKVIIIRIVQTRNIFCSDFVGGVIYVIDFI